MKQILTILLLLGMLGWQIAIMRPIGELTAEADVSRGDAMALTDLGLGLNKTWWAKKAALNDRFNGSYLSDQRSLSLQVTLPVADLLPADKPLPEKVFHVVHAAARTPSHMMGFCPELLATIATACDVTNPQAKITEDGQAVLSAKLRFVPIDRPGVLRQSEHAQEITLHVPRLSNGQLPFTQAGRAQALNQARLLCRAVRNTVGNCVVSRLWMKQVPGQEGQPVFDPQIELTVFADPAQVDQAAMQDVLANLASRLLF